LDTRRHRLADRPWHRLDAASLTSIDPALAERRRSSMAVINGPGDRVQYQTSVVMIRFFGTQAQ
jgi:hypothetical protein